MTDSQYHPKSWTAHLLWRMFGPWWSQIPISPIVKSCPYRMYQFNGIYTLFQGATINLCSWPRQYYCNVNKTIDIVTKYWFIITNKVEQDLASMRSQNFLRWRNCVEDWLFLHLMFLVGSNLFFVGLLLL